ncbi:MAG: hypothetical protein ACOYL6_16375 [Bacteriovoracaceae bacterium]
MFNISKKLKEKSPNNKNIIKTNGDDGDITSTPVTIPMTYTESNEAEENPTSADPAQAID